MNGDNALHFAIKQESDIMVEERLRLEFNHEFRNLDRDTALHVAASRGYAWAVHQPLRWGENCNTEGKGFRTPLHLAMWRYMGYS
ncbi:uncharacterized protein CIMG_07891 [Coccidioides immitis RS]|uniref:Uncharacterized protein n=1 Tax=Coccidioides immitis (strain RS) TaxID=246410 RepID=A0A0E1RV75_COCIM|nr:uncharacterized protein CIMG_07891 [Coccidioides immitis RS]EAS29145.2 hypothetical protein CIMG_07891 [Coccidioides immitis RS]TPX22729.1 hypothetical protein DIZ76_014608 [Coccidioides immitis]